ncbi:uncharacterized protein LOC129290280 isoform X2 [Prosopis cineraria]|uniref:uncharacterized protein LOC129290280 isoform X2 n=1 Tax=Prosopis cineraria TaxID=364024 RepID=UPI00241078DF|nr:uncharacterized protein LOC129290280 isoform X2 [Prosopis cineraria]
MLLVIQALICYIYLKCPPSISPLTYRDSVSVSSLLMTMNSVAVKLAKHLRVSASTSSFHVVAMQRSGRLCYSTTSGSDDDESVDDNEKPKNNAFDEEVDNFLGNQPGWQLQGVDPKRGWNFPGKIRRIRSGESLSKISLDDIANCL